MAEWTATYNGTWTNAANWAGGVPDGVGDTATFDFTHDGGDVQVSILESSDITVSTLNVDMTGTAGLTIKGSTADTGTGAGTLRFDAGLGVAHVNVTSDGSGGNFLISSSGGLNVVLASRTEFYVHPFGSAAAGILAPISGSGRLIKSGLGSLALTASNNTATGGIDITGGTLSGGAGNFGTGAFRISNDAILSAFGTVSNAIRTLPGQTDVAGSAQITAFAGQTLTLTGALQHSSTGIISFGENDAGGTLTASFSSITNAVDASYLVQNNPLRLGSAYVAANLFAVGGAGVVEVVGGGEINTGGYAAVFNNLSLKLGSLVGTSTGALDVTINDAQDDASYKGTFVGTAGTDSLVVNFTNAANAAALYLPLALFSNWTDGVDSIQLNGNAGNNNIYGSTHAEVIHGMEGNDYLAGYGGVDVIYGDGGDDRIQVGNLLGTGHSVHGGDGFDQLYVEGSGNVPLLALSGFERLTFGFGSNPTLTLTSPEFASAFAPNSILEGAGTLIVNMIAGAPVLTKAMTIGSAAKFNVIGSTGDDVIKLGGSAANTIAGGDGSDRVQAGDGAETIGGGIGSDKIAGNGGADTITGGAGADVFKYRNIADSGTGANADVITDFVSGTDKINFSRIDTDPFTAGDQAFTFIDNLPFFNNGVAQVRWVDLGSDLRVEVDINGDTAADMHILLQGAGTQSLTAIDFVL